MPLEPSYVTTGEIRDFLVIGDGVDDFELDRVASTASRMIDQYTNRQFGGVTLASTRFYDSLRSGRGYFFEPFIAPIDDVMDTTDLVVRYASSPGGAYDVTLGLNVDFSMQPINAEARNFPWTEIVFTTNAYPPHGGREIEVTARWGWTYVPDSIVEATLLQASRLFARRNSPYGIAGSPEMGSEMRLLSRVDPDVAVALKKYKRWWTGF